MRKANAFTLIELLVVVSIIALLVAILLPVLSNVKYVTKTTQCSSRLKQIGIAATSAAVDNKDRYPHEVGPVRDRYLNPDDGEYYRWDQKPWSIRSKDRWDYIPFLEPYVSDVSEIFVCPHIDYDWGANYNPSTNATIIPYAIYWGVYGNAVKTPMTKLGEGWGPGNLTDGGGITQDMRYHVLASDYVRLGTSYGINSYPDGSSFTTGMSMGNHPPTGGDYFYKESPDGNGAGYVYESTTNGNANYLYDDGSVVLEGQIRKDTVGNNAQHLFRNGGRWLMPTDRVQ